MTQERPTLAIGVCYRDPRAALKWLEAAFGFETAMVVENADGTLGHSEMRVGRNGLVMVGREWDEFHRSPASLDGMNTQSVHVHLEDADLDEHWRRAIAAGAKPLREPADQFYGDRVYSVADPEGHRWSFSRTLRQMTLQEMSEAGGVTVSERLET
ncbi:MAG TPA: VOC family protein [Caulobacteraceae bacterium]|nr:VOC family protein [Caulobacteraceae bacterium]